MEEDFIDKLYDDAAKDFDYDPNMMLGGQSTRQRQPYDMTIYDGMHNLMEMFDDTYVDYRPEGEENTDHPDYVYITGTGPGITMDDLDDSFKEDCEAITDTDHEFTDEAGSSTSSDIIRVPVRRTKKQMEEDLNLTGQLMPSEINLPYNKNMARTYCGSEARTDEEQERRLKNNILARRSRMVAKFRHDKMLKYNKCMREYVKMKMAYIAHLRAYSNMLTVANGKELTNWEEVDRAVDAETNDE